MASDNQARLPVLRLLLQQLRDNINRTESLMGFPRGLDADLGKVVPNTQTRDLLRMISGVRVDFRDAAQSLLRSRVFLLNQTQLYTYMSDISEYENDPQVQELSYVYINEEYEASNSSDEEDFGRDDNDPEKFINEAVYNLQEITSKLPNLRAIFFAWEYDYQMEDPDLATEIFLNALPFGSQLQAIHIHGGWTSKGLARLCTVVSELNSLSILSIFGLYTKGGNKAKIRSIMPTKPPPKSLTKLQLSVDDIPPIFLTWFFRPRKDYVLRELRLHIWTSLKNGRKDLMSSLSKTLPLLTELALQIDEDPFLSEGSEMEANLLMAKELATKIVSGCSILQHLWLDHFPTFPLPTTLKSLHQTNDISENDSGEEELNSTSEVKDSELETYLRLKLQSGELPNLRGLYLPEQEVYSADGICLLPKTKAVCKEFTIGLVGGDTSPPWTWNRE